MQRQTIVSTWCERIIEGGWLLALALIPIYFNLFSARHFEPDKATTLRAIVLIMVAAGIVRVIDELIQHDSPPDAPAPLEATAGGNPFPRLWQRFNRLPLAVPVLVYALVFIFTTFTSIVPLTSFWGSYQRLQGTYTYFAYIGLFVMIVMTMRCHAQLERLITITLVTSLAVAGYGILQHFQLDALPWRGDVITRVASTMGNSIFVAAYMIMIVPLALYRLITAVHAARPAPATTNPGIDLLWALAQVLLVVGTLTLLLMAMQFSAVVRTVGFRYWWVFPGAVVVATALWTLLTLDLPRQTRRVPLWPGILFGSYLVLLGLVFVLSIPVQTIDESNTRGAFWWLWLLVSTVAISLFYGLALFLPRQSGPASRLTWWLRSAGMLFVTLTLLLATFFTQSRGPWIGLGAGLFVFFFLLFMQLERHARAHAQLALARQLRVGLWSWLGITLLAGIFLIIFNTSDAPIFQRLREVPYVGRMGRLLEVNTGTGKVRRLIWFGDEHAGGAVALITDNPLRMLIGWGPESMFVAFNPFYPPLLTSVESRGASPDRSHQALLDELVTRGLLGLISYFFLIISATVLCWRLMQRAPDLRWQVFFIACMSIVISHVVEGLTGIPIVSTLMMLWVTLAMTIIGGRLAGLLPGGLAYAPVAGPPAPESPPVLAASDAKTSKRSASGSSRRSSGKQSAGASRRIADSRQQTLAQRRHDTGLNPAAVALYGLLGMITLAVVWWSNINLIYADMRFQQAQVYEQPGSGLPGQVMALSIYLDTIRRNPREDFYYLSLGRSLMTIANELRAQNMPLGVPETRPRVDDLLQLQNEDQVIGFVQSRSPLALLSYAEAVLEHARRLNERNKDHYANLGRLNNFWYTWTGDGERLQIAAEWYRQATELAPQDVTLLNERAGIVALQGSYADRQGDAGAAQERYTQAAHMLELSRRFDDRFDDTDARIADLYRLQGRLDEATDQYIAVIERNPHQLNQSIERIAESMHDAPELLQRLSQAYMAQAGDDALLHTIAGLLAHRAGDMEAAIAAYGRAANLQPQSLEYRRNYTIVLSDTHRYAQALDEARATLALAQRQNASMAVTNQLEILISFLQERAAGGQPGF